MHPTSPLSIVAKDPSLLDWMIFAALFTKLGEGYDMMTDEVDGMASPLDFNAASGPPNTSTSVSARSCRYQTALVSRFESPFHLWVYALASE